MAEDPTKSLLELLIQINREVAAAPDLRTVLQRLVFAAMQHVGAERGTIIVLDDTGKPVDATIVYGKSLLENSTQQLKETMDRGLAGWVIRHRKAALVPDTSMDERWLRRPDDAFDRSGPKSALCVPLIARERLVGVLTLVHSVPKSFGTEHLELTQAIADQASIAVLNARLYAESSRQARIMTAIADGAAVFSASLDLHEVWQRVLNQTLQAMQVETAAIGLIEGPEQSIVYHAAAGLNSAKIIDRRIPGGQGLAGQVAREGHGIIIPHVKGDKRFTDIDRFTGIEPLALAIAPIQSQGRVIGVLEAINPVSHIFDPDALTVMIGIGGLAGTTIINAQLFERLQTAHQRYHELFQESIDPILITDWEGKITEANHAAANLSGYKTEELQYMSIDQLHQVDWNQVGLKFENLRVGEGFTYEGVLHQANAEKLPIEVRTRRVVFEDTDSIQWTVRNISERKELDSMRQDLTSMIYHDLRSPLSNIVSSLDVLGGMISDDEATRSILNVAVHSTGRIQRLVNSLLDIYRLEAGQPIEALTVINPEELIKNAVSDVSPSSEGRRQTIRTKIEEKLPELRGDADMLRRVIINLLENAIKFSKTEAEIEIGASRSDNSVQFWIKDSGPGVPPAEQKRIFEKFARIKTSVEHRPSGLGIGLAFCRMAVSAHGGKIWVESETGKGSKFIFTVPLKNTKK